MMRDYLKKVFSKENLTNNIKLKIASLFFAIVVWIAVVSITDPVISQPYKNIPVRLVNTNVITENGKTLEILDGTDIIANISVRASRNTIREIGTTADSILATADFSRLSADGTSVPIDIVTSKYNDKVDRIRSSSETLKVKIENKKSVQLPIQTTTSGDVESGYILGNITLSQNQVKVSGPESVIDIIKTAKVDVQVSGFTENISTQADIIFYDENGEAVSKKNLDANADNVKITVEILATKRVPIKYSTFGNPADGYGVTGEIECSPDSIVIAGPSSEIDNISAITIPESELNLTGQSSNVMTVIDLAQFLPENMRFADPSFKGKVSLKIYIEPLIEDNFGVDSHEISVEGVPEGLEAQIEDGETYEIILRGLAQDLERISLNSLNYRVDCSKLITEDEEVIEPGVYELMLELDLPDNITIENEVLVRVRLF